jgi:hypothetical protein
MAKIHFARKNGKSSLIEASVKEFDEYLASEIRKKFNTNETDHKKLIEIVKKSELKMEIQKIIKDVQKETDGKWSVEMRHVVKWVTK